MMMIKESQNLELLVLFVKWMDQKESSALMIGREDRSHPPLEHHF